jgi:hypothetical protein
MLVRRIVIFSALPYGLLLCALLGFALPPSGSRWALIFLGIVTSVFPHLKVALATGHGINEAYLWLIAAAVSLVIAVWTSLLSRERSFGAACAIYAGLTVAEVALVGIMLRIYGDPWGVFQSNWP